MKYIITEEQHMENIEYIKPLAFKYWTKYGPNEFDIDKVMGVFSIVNTNRNIRMVNDWLLEWYGGKDGLRKILSEYEGKVFNGVDGTYDFRFFVKGISVYSHDGVNVYFDIAFVDGDGEIYVEHDDEVFTNIHQAVTFDDNIGWEIEDEIRDIIVQTLGDIIKIQFIISVDSIVVSKPGEFDKMHRLSSRKK